MSTSVRDLFQQASELDEHDRATLAGLLLESLEDKVDEECWRFLLFSEFAFDLSMPLPEALANVPWAPEAARLLIEDLCVRLRNDRRTQPTYLDRAAAIEGELNLPNLCSHLPDLGTRDTFPFEERAVLRQAMQALVHQDTDAVRALLPRHAQSIWSGTGESQAQWGLLQAAVQLIDACDDYDRQLSDHTRDQEAPIDFYLASLREVDRLQREFEHAIGDAVEAHEIMASAIEQARTRYGRLAATVQVLFTRHLEASGWPPSGRLANADVFDRLVAPKLLAVFDGKVVRKDLLHRIKKGTNVPTVEANFNLIELGPRGTGKSYFFSEFSPYSTLISGGQATKAILFYNNARQRTGLVGFWDTVAFDEVSGIKVKDPDTIQIMKDYMANGRFSRGVDAIADASLAFVGNLDVAVEQVVNSTEYDLFHPLPSQFDLAVMDRFACYVPGWEMPKNSSEYLTSCYGFITDYLAEAFHYQLSHTNRYEEVSQRIRLGSAIEGWDEKGIKKTVCAFLKILHPDGVPTEAEFDEYVAYAAEGRRRVKEQMNKRKPDDEFANIQLSYVSANGTERR